MYPINWLILLFVSLFNFATVEDSPNFKLIVFEGSDWCVNCIQLEKNILSDAVFIEYSQTKEIEIERIDFPQRKKQDKEIEKYNAEMAEKYEFDGTFPTVILIEEERSKLTRIPSTKHNNTEDFLNFIQEKISLEE